MILRLLQLGKQVMLLRKLKILRQLFLPALILLLLIPPPQLSLLKLPLLPLMLRHV
jgi:hypothetical protein